MSYLALARQWRPKTFEQLLGQEQVSQPLSNALKQNRIHHAYLFTGTRGVGKTSVARILAKALNCETGVSASPCLQCAACLSIEQGRFIDLIEIDAASKTRVEDTRELLENLAYAPAQGRFKIYLIDEVHMLSSHSFNALLKTLEEPPEHVKFILATTDPQKIPNTILSRCLQFHLRPLLPPLIKKQLQLILDAEKIQAEEEALSVLAACAQGSMRDALSLLDKAIANSPERLTKKSVDSLLGHTHEDHAPKLLQALADKNAAALIEAAEAIAAEGGHFEHVLDALLQKLHALCIYQALGETHPLIEAGPAVKTLAPRLSPETLQLFYHIGLKGKEELSLAPTPGMGFTMVLLRMLTFQPAPEATSLAPQKAAPPTETKPLPEKPPAAAVEKPWSHIVAQLDLNGLAATALTHAEFSSKEGKTITLKVAKGHASLFTPAIIKRIEEALSKYHQSPIKLALRQETAVTHSLAQEQAAETRQKEEKANDALDSDPVFQAIKETFSAELVKNSMISLE